MLKVRLKPDVTSKGLAFLLAGGQTSTERGTATEMFVQQDGRWINTGWQLAPTLTRHAGRPACPGVAKSAHFADNLAVLPNTRGDPSTSALHEGAPRGACASWRPRCS